MTNQTLVPTEAIARKLVSAVDAGLVSGLGRQVPGKMCVEAAVCYAFGLKHGDHPPCVGSAVRSFKISLNDCAWSSNKARARGMRRLAVAQLGSDSLSQVKFGEEMFIRGASQLLPFLFRKVAKDPEVKPEHALEFIKHADRLEKVKTIDQAKSETKSASAYAYASASASAYDSAYASAYAYASAHASAHDSAYDSAWFRNNMGDEFLNMKARIGLDVLKEMKSPGCKWLWLCD